MGIQEQNMTAIANAIREKEGSTAKIQASEFAQRILSINTIPSDVREINVTSSDTSIGSVSGGGYGSDGMKATISANSIGKAEFLGWKENGSLITEANPYTFTISKNMNIIGYFQKKNFYNILYQSTVPVNAYKISCGIYFKNKFYLFGGDSNTSGFILQSSDGINWTKIKTTGFKGKYIATNGNICVLCTTSEEKKYSYDCINWTDCGYTQGGTIIYGGDKFLILPDGSYATGTSYSNDGINWTSGNLPRYSKSIYAAYGNGIFVTVDNTNAASSGTILYSEDGISWDMVNTSKLKFSGLAFGNGKFYLMGKPDSQYTTVAMYSENGKDWTSYTPTGYYTGSTPNNYLENLSFCGGQFFACGGSSALLAWSEDAINWNLYDKGTYYATFIYGNETVVVAIGGGTSSSNSDKIYYIK